MNARFAAATILVGAFGRVAGAQPEAWVFQTDRSVLTPAHPHASINIYAAFAPENYAFALADLDVLIDPVLEFDFAIVLNCGTAGCWYTITDRGVERAKPSQLNFPPGMIYADPANPLRAMWLSVTALSHEPSAAMIQTVTREFLVYPERESTIAEARAVADAVLAIGITDCEADCDTDGELSLFDFLCFQNLFAAGDGYADCDGNGGHDLLDFLCFQNHFAGGCP